MTKFTGLALFLSWAITLIGAEPGPSLTLRPREGISARLLLESPAVPPVGGTQYRWQYESSWDLQTWIESGELEAGSADEFQSAVTLDGDARFFRLRAAVVDTGRQTDGAELFGYDRIFREELRRVGFLSSEAFAAQHQPSPDYLAGLSYDPRRSPYWDAFNADPAVVNAALPANTVDRRLYDFRLNEAELALFRQNGFVVSERLGSYSFADVFYRIFSDDLPVFISADAILHAWHFSYQRLLEEAEETQLAPQLQLILDGMANALSNLPSTVRDGPLRSSIEDADYFLTVGRSLLRGTREPSILGLDAAVAQTLEAINKREYVPLFPMFGTHRAVDFSQFQIRGHYERSPGLGAYFQTFLWTALTDLRWFGLGPDGKPAAQSVRELGTAIVLSHLLDGSGQTARWEQVDDLIRLLVGRSDAMTPAQMRPLVRAAGLTALESITSLDQVRAMHERIRQGDLGLQLIPGAPYVFPVGSTPIQLPRSYVLTGQRFNPDGWALAQVTFSRIAWNEEIPGYTHDGWVIRRYPSALDLAYAVLGNRQVGHEIGQRMLQVAARAGFRDGLPYAHNLTALANTFDRVTETAWNESIANRWLAALRELSAPTTDARFPESMRTRAWMARTLNTQLASYTELKHDTVLYAKQPYTGIILCEYPAGFVEPVPRFWRALQQMAEATAEGMERLTATGTIQIPRGDGLDFLLPFTVDLARQRTERIQFCRSFAGHMGTLQRLAEKELAQQPFEGDEIAFIKGLMNRQDRDYVGPTFDGWYPSLFYKDYGQQLSPELGGTEDPNGSNKHDPLITDIHTAPPDFVDPIGGVLHQATGNVDLLLIAVDNGPDRMVYAGPTLSHYEFIEPGPKLRRWTDDQWSREVGNPKFDAILRKQPERPVWTRSYLVPRP